jgi:acetoacetate decarboxylase
MGFVRTPQEIERIQEVLERPRFTDCEMLQVEFLTDANTVAHVLPPPLEPASEPLMVAMVGRWRSNCVGDYTGGALYVSARYQDIEATYVLAMYMDTDHAIVFGRDVFGEPKTQAQIDLRRRGHAYHGWVERHGVRLIDIRADVPTDLGADRGQGANFNIKSSPACDGTGLENDAVLTFAEFDTELLVNREGTGTLALQGTVHDPLDEIQVVNVRRATYVEGDLNAQARALTTIPAKQFLPYAYGRLDDWSALDTTEQFSAATAG